MTNSAFAFAEKLGGTTRALASAGGSGLQSTAGNGFAACPGQGITACRGAGGGTGTGGEMRLAAVS